MQPYYRTVLDDTKQTSLRNYMMYFCGLMALQYVMPHVNVVFPLITKSTGNELRHTHNEASNYHNLGFSVYLPIDSRVVNAGAATNRFVTQVVIPGTILNYLS